MRILSLSILLCLFSFFTQAQNENTRSNRSREEVNTLIKRGGHQGGFFAFSFRGTEIHDEAALLVGGRVGWNIDRVLALGVEAHGLVPTVSHTALGLNPSNVRPLMGYGGIFAEPILGSNRAFHLTFPLFLGGGWIGYVDDWNDTNQVDMVEDDIVWVAEPGANLEINLSRWMRLGIGASYRFVGGNQRTEMAFGEDFQGMSYNFMIKLGRF